LSRVNCKIAKNICNFCQNSAITEQYTIFATVIKQFIPEEPGAEYFALYLLLQHASIDGGVQIAKSQQYQLNMLVFHSRGTAKNQEKYRNLVVKIGEVF